MAAPIIIAVGSALIKTTIKQAPKLLRRFKNARQVKNPTVTQLDNAHRLNKGYTNFNKTSKKVLQKADSAAPSLFQRVTGTGRTAAQKEMKINPASTTGEAKRAATKNKLIGGGVVLGLAGMSIAQLKKKLNESNSEITDAKIKAAIKDAERSLQDKSKTKTTLRPKARPSNTVTKSLRPKARPKK
tara:strand:+ start:69 stop:626 length:558 start_codon:yes stop_codon:yes gene_type:complete